MGSVAIGPFQNKIERKKTATNRLDKPKTKLEEPKDTKIRKNELTRMIPRRISSLDKVASFTVSTVSLTKLQDIYVDKSFISKFFYKNQMLFSMFF